MKFEDLLPFYVDELQKIAEEQKHPLLERAKIKAKYLGGFTLGTAGGILAGEGANRLHKHFTGKDIHPAIIRAAIPLVGLAAGMAYTKMRKQENEELENVLKNKTDTGPGRIPGS